MKEEKMTFKELISFEYAIKRNKVGAYIIIAANVLIFIGALMLLL